MRSAGACRIGKWQRLEAALPRRRLGWALLRLASTTSAPGRVENGGPLLKRPLKETCGLLCAKYQNSYLSGAGEARLSEPKKLTHIAFPGPQLRFSEGRTCQSL